MRAFFRLRKAFGEVGVPRLSIRPESKISSLLPGRRRRDLLSDISQRAGLEPLGKMPFGLQFTFGRVRDMVTDAVIEQHKRLRLLGHGWSQRQVKEVVRAVIFTQLALRKFSDEAEFVRDLKID